MKNSIKLLINSLLVASLIVACNRGPKVIQSTDGSAPSQTSSGVFSDDKESGLNQNNTNGSSSMSEDIHAVLVNEVLPTSKYVYLNVLEGEKKYWIATRKKDVKKGKKYFYKGGLLKTNYESKEYDRIFDTLILVSNLVQEDHSDNTGAIAVSNENESSSTAAQEGIPSQVKTPIVKEGSVKIADLVKNPKKYAGKTIQLSGKCVKINPGIMNRNWIHLQDGTKNDFDLVITSETFIPEGTNITVKALVTLNKDFGAGYKYDLILENGTFEKI